MASPCDENIFAYYGKSIILKSHYATDIYNDFTNFNRSLSSEEMKQFKAFFGTTPFTCFIIWDLLNEYNLKPKNGTPCHLLWAMMLMKLYNQESVMASLADTTVKTFRKWSWLFVSAIQKLQPYVVSFLCLFSL